MRKILRDISVNFLNQNEIDGKLVKYLEMKKHKGWEVHQEFLLLMRGAIAEDMLSATFTKLDKDEKDSKQRAYSHVDEIIRFLLNPVEKAQKFAGIMKHNQKLSAQAQREQP